MSRTVIRSLAFCSLLAVTPLRAQETPKAAPAPATKQAAPARPAAAAQPPVYDPNALATKALEWTQEVSLLSGRRMFVNLGTNDCDPCRVVNTAMHDKKFFEVFIKQFVPVFLDVSPRSKNRGLLKEYGIDASKGLPAIAIFSPEGKLLEVTKEGELVAVAAKGQDAIQNWILERFAR